MTDSDFSWEPPLAGSEAEHLAGALDRLRTTFRWKVDGLDSAELQARISTSALTLGGLLKHLARVEEEIFTVKLTGDPLGAPWDSTAWGGEDDPEFDSAAGDTPEQLYALWDGAVARFALAAGRSVHKRRCRPARPHVQLATVGMQACAGCCAT